MADDSSSNESFALQPPRSPSPTFPRGDDESLPETPTMGSLHTTKLLPAREESSEYLEPPEFLEKELNDCGDSETALVSANPIPSRPRGEFRSSASASARSRVPRSRHTRSHRSRMDRNNRGSRSHHSHARHPSASRRHIVCHHSLSGSVSPLSHASAVPQRRAVSYLNSSSTDDDSDSDDDSPIVGASAADTVWVNDFHRQWRHRQHQQTRELKKHSDHNAKKTMDVARKEAQSTRSQIGQLGATTGVALGIISTSTEIVKDDTSEIKVAVKSMQEMQEQLLTLFNQTPGAIVAPTDTAAMAPTVTAVAAVNAAVNTTIGAAAATVVDRVDSSSSSKASPITIVVDEAKDRARVAKGLPSSSSSMDQEESDRLSDVAEGIHREAIKLSEIESEIRLLGRRKLRSQFTQAKKAQRRRDAENAEAFIRKVVRSQPQPPAAATGGNSTARYSATPSASSSDTRIMTGQSNRPTTSVTNPSTAQNLGRDSAKAKDGSRELALNSTSEKKELADAGFSDAENSIAEELSPLTFSCQVVPAKSDEKADPAGISTVVANDAADSLSCSATPSAALSDTNVLAKKSLSATLSLLGTVSAPSSQLVASAATMPSSNTVAATDSAAVTGVNSTETIASSASLACAGPATSSAKSYDAIVVASSSHPLVPSTAFATKPTSIGPSSTIAKENGSRMPIAAPISGINVTEKRGLSFSSVNIRLAANGSDKLKAPPSTGPNLTTSLTSFVDLTGLSSSCNIAVTSMISGAGFADFTVPLSSLQRRKLRLFTKELEEFIPSIGNNMGYDKDVDKAAGLCMGIVRMGGLHDMQTSKALAIIVQKKMGKNVIGRLTPTSGIKQWSYVFGVLAAGIHALDDEYHRRQVIQLFKDPLHSVIMLQRESLMSSNIIKRNASVQLCNFLMTLLRYDELPCLLSTVCDFVLAVPKSNIHLLTSCADIIAIACTYSSPKTLRSVERGNSRGKDSSFLSRAIIRIASDASKDTVRVVGRTPLSVLLDRDDVGPIQERVVTSMRKNRIANEAFLLSKETAKTNFIDITKKWLQEFSAEAKKTELPDLKKKF